MDHLLLHCPNVYNLWALIFTIFGVNWVLPRSINDTFGMVEMSTIQKIPKKSLDGCPFMFTMDNFLERNGVVFEDLVPSTQLMKNSLIFALWSWATANSNVQAVNVIDFLDALVTM